MRLDHPTFRFSARAPHLVLLYAMFFAMLLAFATPRAAGAAADPKTIAKCQAGLAKAGAKFVAKKIGTLAKCTDGVFKCIQTVDETADAGVKRTACIEKARAKCAGALTAITAARQAFVAGAIKACAALDAAQVTANDGLGYTGLDCSDFGGAVTDLTSLTGCLAKQHDCLASQIFQLQVPRVLELLQFTPPAAVTVASADADALACLDDAGGTGADVNDVALGKSVAKCQKAVEKIGAKLASKRLAALSKCVTTLFACAETKTGADLTKCNTKAKAGCAKAFIKNDETSTALGAAVAKSCGDPLVFPAFLSPAGGNLQALLPSALVAAPRAVSLGCFPLVTVADYQACLVRNLLDLADDLVGFEAPRTESLLADVGCTVDGCSAGPPTNGPGITQILTAAGDGTHAFAADTDASGFATDAAGNVYVSGGISKNVFKITLDGTITQILDASGDGQGHPCNFPGALAVGPNDTLYVACDTYVFKLAGGSITPIIGPAGDGSPDGDLRFASALAIGPDESVYVAGGASDNAFKITKAGTITKILTELGDGNHTVSEPRGIVLDSQGNVFVTSLLVDDGTVFKIATNGTVTADITTLSEPSTMVAFGDTFYIVDYNEVVKRAPNGTITTVLDSTGDGQGHTLNYPNGLALDAVGNLYVACRDTDNAFKVTPGGVVTQVIGPDGDGDGHLLDRPFYIAVDGEGRIYTGSTTLDNAFRIVLP